MSEIPKVPPEDNHNLELVSNVHPSDWENPDPAPMYNLVVIGAGTAGLVSAAGAAGLGAKVALVERHLLGGDCLNYGCVPSKCIIRSSRVYSEIRDAHQYGFHGANEAFTGSDQSSRFGQEISRTGSRCVYRGGQVCVA